MKARGRGHTKKSFIPPPTPLQLHQFGGRRDSDASFASSRPSSVGLGRSAAGDLINDRSYQQSAVRAINAYLSSRSFPLLIKSTLPSAKDITAIVNFIISQLEYPNPKMDEDLPILLKSLNCPFKISKSALRTPATPHAWPTFVAVIHWLVQIALYNEDLAPNTSSMANENTMHAYALEGYLHYIRGDDDSVETVDGDFMKKLEHERDAIVDKVKRLEKDASELKARADALKTGPSQRELLERDKSVLEVDKKKFETMIEEYERRNVKLKSAMDEKEKELMTKEEETKRICQENEELKKTVESQAFNTRDVERMKKEMQVVEREIADAEVERNNYEDKCWDLEATLGHKLKELEELAKECNRTIRKLKVGGDLQYLLNPQGTTPSEVMGIDYKSSITPAMDSHIDEINKSSVVKLEEMIALQQKLKDHSVMMEKKRHQVEILHSRVEELEAQLNSLKKETQEYVHRCAVEVKRMWEDLQTEAHNMHIVERGAEEVLKASELKLQDTIRKNEEEIQRCAFELFTMLDSVSGYKEYLEGKIFEMKTSLSDTAKSISDAYRASPPTPFAQSLCSENEPSLIPEWLKSSGSATTVAYGSQSASYLQSDDHSLSRHARNKSSFFNSEHDGSRSTVSEKMTSSYFRRSASGKDSSRSRSYSSFHKSHRHREWEDVHDLRDKDRPILGDHRNYEYPAHVGVLPGKFSKETLRHSQSMISRKLEGTSSNKVVGDSGISSNNKDIRKGSSPPISNDGAPSSTQILFVRDFPSLGVDQKQNSSELRRVPSPVLPSAIHNLPGAGHSMIGGDGWTSSLAEVPGVIASSSTAILLSQQAAVGSSGCVAQRSGGLNMAEAVVQGPSRARTPPQVSVDTQRLEELAIKQSRQLIPVIPSTPKSSLLGPSDKSKPKAGVQLAHATPSQGIQSLRGGSTRFDSGKVSGNLGKLQVLKPARELNGVSSNVVKENLSPKNGVKVVNTPLSLNPTSAAASAPIKVAENTQTTMVAPQRKSAAISATIEKKPSPIQAQSRSDFFNLLKKKSSSSVSNVSSGNESVPSNVDDSHDSLGGDTPTVTTNGPEKCNGSSSLQSEDGDNVMANGGISDHNFFENGGVHLDIDVPYPDEKEAAFLRSLGWEESAGEDEGLTEDEIRYFYETVMVKRRPGPQCTTESE
ncbi:hypothetical protein SAY86_003550 [Trapa natans]|uniref:Kinetochore protein Ndc80 CH domain-containing protein n=1 Tax=Trapa natans TaxID=22666 RepID=A0AAN7RPD7_TRANT|nr:hypothetical protein SAY86_003550 [Trapa natans]